MLIIGEELFDDSMCFFFDYLEHFEILFDDSIEGFERHILFLFVFYFFESDEGGGDHTLLLGKAIFPGLDLLFVVEFGVDLDAIWTERLEAVERGAVVSILLVGMLPTLDPRSTRCVHFKSCKLVYSNADYS